MVDPENITNYNLTDGQLEEQILFWVTAAGKNGRVAARSLATLLDYIQTFLQRTVSPFAKIKWAAKHLDLPLLMKECGIGCYNHKSKTFSELAFSDLNLRTCTSDELEKIHGIGMKTSRCFIMHSRKNARYAGLDTHILKFLRAAGIEDVPKSTPGSKKEYLRLEQEFLKLSDKVGKTPADFDLEIWNKYSVKPIDK